MHRKILAAAALACALALTVAYAVGAQPPLFQGLTLLSGVAVCAYGIHAGRGRPAVLTATLVALAGLAIVALSGPAAANPQRVQVPTFSALTLPDQPLALAAPTAPAQVVVTVDKANAVDTSVALPISDWLNAVRSFLEALVLGVLGFALRKLPAPVVWLVKAYGVQKLVEQAVAMGINAVPGASRDGPLNIDVGNKVLAHALQWAVDEVPGFVLKLAGGEDGLRQKIFAALHLEADASAADLGVPTA